MNKRVIAVFFALIMIFTNSNAAYAKNYHEDDIEKYIVEQMLAADIPGMSMSIVTSGREVYSASFGDVPNTTSDLEIGSLSKNFTALAAMQLIEDGKLDADKKVSEYTPEYSGVSDVTIRDLLNQTSGISEEEYIDNISSGSGKGMYKDANGNFNLLGKIIEKVSGQSYSDYVKQHIFDPLGMKSTYTIDSKEAASEYVSGHSNFLGLPVKNKDGISKSDGWIESASSGIISDVKDMGMYLQMYLNAGGKILTYDTMNEMLSYKGNVPSGKGIFGKSSTYGMGWNRTQVNEQNIYYCCGATAGYSSAMFLIPSQDVGITILCNSSDVVAGNKLMEKTAAGVVNLVIGQKAKTIDSNKYLAPHIGIDALYLLIALIALVPLFTIGIWYKISKKRRSIVKTIADVVIHIIIPTIALIIIPKILGKWSMIKMLIPDAYYICIGSIVILYIGAVIKVILRIMIGRRDFSEDISDEEDDESDDEEDTLKEEDETEATEADAAEEVSKEDVTKENVPEVEEQSDVSGDTVKIPDIKAEDKAKSKKHVDENGDEYRMPKKLILEPSSRKDKIKN